MPEVTPKNPGRIPDAEAVERLRAAMRGWLLEPADTGYDQARSIWNAMIDRRPGLIARCAGTADVMHAVAFARRHDLLVAVRGGAHNIAGNAVSDGGLMIDLSPMRSVRVDPRGRTARVEPGALLGDFDKEAQAFGLATPLGINSTTGVAGLTLGGGFGWLSRKFGLSIDNLLSADVVTADGKLLRASEDENADLFWGIRGGGGNFGVVTSFEFRLHEVGPEVLAGFVFYPFDRAPELLRRYRDFVKGAPDELTCWTVLRKAPPLPFLPHSVHGHEVMILPILHVGDAEAGRRALQPLEDWGQPIANVVGPMPYLGFQAAFDPLLTAGARNYWKSHAFTDLPDAALDLLVQYARALPTPECEILIAQLGGAVKRVADTATAYPHRNAEFLLNVHTRWQAPEQDSACVEWARQLFDATAPFSTGGVYVNFISAGEERVRAAYGANYDRLVEIKNKYDPTNLFRMNQNIPPTAKAA